MFYRPYYISYFLLPKLFRLLKVACRPALPWSIYREQGVWSDNIKAGTLLRCRRLLWVRIIKCLLSFLPVLSQQHYSPLSWLQVYIYIYIYIYLFIYLNQQSEYKLFYKPMWWLSDFGGLEVAYWPLVPKFAGSNPAEAVGFFRAKKSSARLPSEGK